MWKGSIAFTRFSKTSESHGLGTVPTVVNKAEGSLSSGIYSPGEWKTNEQIITVQRCVLCLRKYSVGTKKDHLYQAEGWVSPEAPWRHWLLNWGLQSEKEVEFGLVKKGLGKRSGIGRRMSVPGLCLCKDPESRDTLAIHKLKRVCMVQA